MNQGSDSILSVYSDARTEYTKQLCIFLVPAFFRFFIDLLEKAKQNTSLEPKKTLWQFQTYLNEIHDWNMEKVTNEINIIYNNCGCDYLDDLLTAVFIAHTKVLTAIRISSNNKKVQITVPKVEHFLFKVLCESSKLLWSSAFLFRDGISGIEKQQNYRNIEQLLNEGILQAIRSLVPVKSILKDFVSNDNDSDSDSDDEEDVKHKHSATHISESVSEENKVENAEHSENIQNIISESELTQCEQTTLESHPIQTFSESSEPSESISNTTEQEQTISEQSINSLQQSELKQELEQKQPELQPQQQQPQMIYIEDRPTVQFTDFDAVFDSDNPHNSDMIFDPKDGEDSDSPALEILDDAGVPLSDDLEFDSIESASAIEYDVLP